MIKQLIKWAVLMALFSGVLVASGQDSCDGAGVIVCEIRDLDGIQLSDGPDQLTIAEGARVRNDIGMGVDAGGGDDVVVNNGLISALVRGIRGGLGNDRLINNGEIRDGDSGMYGGRGDDYLENNGVIVAREGGMESSDLSIPEFLVGTVVNNGQITVTLGDGIVSTGDVTNNGRIQARRHGILGVNIINNNYVLAYGGDALRGRPETDDTIINFGYAQGVNSIQAWEGDDDIRNYGDLRGNVQGWFGNDTITIYGGRIQGTINCGVDVDVLIFAQTVTPAEYERVDALLAQANPQDGRITINRQSYQWINCEILENRMTIQ